MKMNMKVSYMTMEKLIKKRGENLSTENFQSLHFQKSQQVNLDEVLYLLDANFFATYSIVIYGFILFTTFE